MPHESAWPRLRSVVGRKIRIDVNEPESPAPEGDRGKLTEPFRSLIGIPGRDRRSLSRHAAAEFAIWLGWWRGEPEFFAIPARQVNLSRGGAPVTAIDPPPGRHTVWICHGSPVPTECVEAKVLAVAMVRRLEYGLRLAFTGPCPHRLLEAAVCGLAPSARGAAPPRRCVEGG